MKIGIAMLAIAMFTACTTIDISKPLFAIGPHEPFSGMSNEGPPSSINPTSVRLRFYADDTIGGFNLRVESAKVRLEKLGYTITRTRPVYHAHDGIWWKRGDIHEVIIYYREKE